MGLGAVVATCLMACSVSLAANTHTPAGLTPVIECTPTVPLPVESLRALHDLDLTQPVDRSSRQLYRRIAQQVKALKLEAAEADTAAAPGMLMLQPPVVSSETVAESSPTAARPAATKPQSSEQLAKKTNRDSAREKSDDLPPQVPNEFKPEWRSTRQQAQDSRQSKSQRVAESFTLPIEAESEGDSGSDAGPDAGNDKPIAKREPDAKQQKSDRRVASDTQASESETDSSETNAHQPEGNKRKQVVQTPPAAPLKPLTRNQIYLRNKLRRVLSHYYRKPLNSREHDAWEAMHGMLAYGLKSRIRAGGPRGESMTAIGWLCYNNPCERKQLMRLNDEGEIRAQYGVGLQGHMGQFLAMLAQCNVDQTYPIRVEGKEFTIEDLIVAEQKTCYTGTELTFKLIGLMHYLPSDSTWINDRGETWSIERLIAEELKQPVRGAACGGTHRLGGLSLAVKKREARGEPLDGEFLRAAQFTRRYEQYAYRLQNSDGSFSTEWFRGPGRETDINRRCRTSGHLLEWLLYQAKPEELTSYRIVKGTNYLTNLLYQNPNNEWEIGPHSHALHALAVYDKLVFQPHDAPAQVADGKPEADTQATTSVRTSQSTQRNSSARRTTQSSNQSRSSSAGRPTYSRRSR